MHRQAPESQSDWHPIWKKYHETWLWPDFHYLLWNDDDNRKVVQAFFPQYLEVFDRFPLDIYRIDFARNLFLKKWGGVYVDMDFVCYRSFYDLLDSERPSLLESGADDEVIQNSMMASPPDHPFWDAVAENSIQFFYENEDRIMANREEDIPEMVKGCTGPFNLTKTFEQVGGGVKVLPRDKFNPWPLPQDKSDIYCYHYQTGQWGIRETKDGRRRQSKRQNQRGNAHTEPYRFNRHSMRGGMGLLRNP